MAATNKDIIAAYKTAHNIPLTTPLYTWAVWHNMGYRVRKGELSKSRRSPPLKWGGFESWTEAKAWANAVYGPKNYDIIIK